MIDFDLLSEIVIEEQKTEITRNMRYLEAVFNAADVDGDGVLTFDEFTEMVRRVEPNLSRAKERRPSLPTVCIQAVATRSNLQRSPTARSAMAY